MKLWYLMNLKYSNKVTNKHPTRYLKNSQLVSNYPYININIFIYFYTLATISNTTSQINYIQEETSKHSIKYSNKNSSKYPTSIKKSIQLVLKYTLINIAITIAISIFLYSCMSIYLLVTIPTCETSQISQYLAINTSA